MHRDECEGSDAHADGICGRMYVPDGATLLSDAKVCTYVRVRRYVRVYVRTYVHVRVHRLLGGACQRSGRPPAASTAGSLRLFCKNRSALCASWTAVAGHQQNVPSKCESEYATAAGHGPKLGPP
jgi:hypothetical protein